jgi:hypothetical protein
MCSQLERDVTGGDEGREQGAYEAEKSVVGVYEYAAERRRHLLVRRWCWEKDS